MVPGERLGCQGGMQTALGNNYLLTREEHFSILKSYDYTNTFWLKTNPDCAYLLG